MGDKIIDGLIYKDAFNFSIWKFIVFALVNLITVFLTYIYG